VVRLALDMMLLLRKVVVTGIVTMVVTDIVTTAVTVTLTTVVTVTIMDMVTAMEKRNVLTTTLVTDTAMIMVTDMVMTAVTDIVMKTTTVMVRVIMDTVTEEGEVQKTEIYREYSSTSWPILWAVSESLSLHYSSNISAGTDPTQYVR